MTDAGNHRISGRGALSNASWNGFATIWSIALSFLSAPLLIHDLGAAGYGLLLLVWSVAGLLSITNLGIGEATLRYVAHYLADDDMPAVNRVFECTLTFFLLISLVIAAAVLVATPAVISLINLPEKDQRVAAWLLKLSVVLFSTGLITNAFRSVPMAMQRYDISSKVDLFQSSVRTIGFIILARAGFGVLEVVLWDLLVAVAVLCLYIGIARRVLPTLRWLPGRSLSGLREVLGYGTYSFLTHVFLSVYRESGKLILGNHSGPSAVAYLGTPDSITLRLSMVIISGIETLMPRFSANRDRETAKTLVANATWTALTAAAVSFVPLAVLMPDFLRLWIGEEFARESGEVGRLLAIGFIGPVAFSPIATYFRGVGTPRFVTIVMATVGIAVLATSVLLVPSYGPVGVGYGYIVGCFVWLVGLCVGWFSVFRAPCVLSLVRALGIPIFVATLGFVLQTTIRNALGELNWPGLVVVGGLFSMSILGLALAADRVMGGDSAATRMLERLRKSCQIGIFASRRQLWRVGLMGATRRAKNTGSDKSV